MYIRAFLATVFRDMPWFVTIETSSVSFCLFTRVRLTRSIAVVGLTFCRRFLSVIRLCHGFTDCFFDRTFDYFFDIGRYLFIRFKHAALRIFPLTSSLRFCLKENFSVNCSLHLSTSNLGYAREVSSRILLPSSCRDSFGFLLRFLGSKRYVSACLAEENLVASFDFISM